MGKMGSEGYFRVLISSVERFRKGKAVFLAFAFLEVEQKTGNGGNCNYQ
jgi:hypothetical protein